MISKKKQGLNFSYLVVGMMMALPASSQAGLFDFLKIGNKAPSKPVQQSKQTGTQSTGKSFEANIKGGKPWIIAKQSWSEADEARFSDFVSSIYESGCTTVPSCMSGSGNWYKDKDPAGMQWFADCGRFPYLLRSYFAFHNGLPFQAAISAAKRDPNDPNTHLQYTSKGNYIANRWSVKSGTNGYQFIRQTVANVYSSVYRVDSRLDTDTGQFSDFYHVKISRKHIRPGTVVYDPNGHIATVAKVTDQGKVILLDSHPDNSVSRVIYTGAFAAKSMSQSGGFKNWRPVSVVNGKTVTASNAESPGFSLEQFVGDQPNDAGFSKARWSTSDGILPSSKYLDVVRARLSLGAVKYNPIEEIKSEVGNICMMMQDRIASVNAAIVKGIDKKSMPNGQLPDNIYGTAGEWEEYSTPSRDARLKTAAAEFYSDVVRMYDLYKAHDAKVIYNGNDLVGDMLAAFDEASSSCVMTYQKSNGRNVALDFNSYLKRIYAMSFDPYHCVEVRMGAMDSNELASCQQSETKNAWYKAEQSIRNSLNRPYEKKMGWTLSELQNGAAIEAGVGITTRAPVDIRSFLTSVR